MDKLGKVLKGLDCCIGHGKPAPRLGNEPRDCENCPYSRTNGINNTLCFRQLQRDALELLKAQKEKDELQKEEMAGVDSAFDKIIGDMRELLEKTTPKVMTLDEVADLEEHQFVWIEINDSDEPVYCLEIVRFRGVLCVNLEITLNAFRDIVIVYTKNYNKEYRFWTHKPTDNQREETPWEK